MKALLSYQEAEKLQLSQAMQDSSGSTTDRSFQKSARPATPDGEVALRLMMEDARLSGDALFAQASQHSEDSNATMSLQYAQKLAAEEKKLAIDAEFARRLQEADEDDDNPDGADAEHMKSAERYEDHACYHEE